ncbi:DUF2593 family protein [Edwardsiella anguillarum]|nr:DUF2593 family protein [Edwardsiella anguillarum]
MLLAGLGLWLIELGCGAAVMRGSARGRGIYLGCQLLVTGYMLCSSLGGFHPELFSVDGDDSGQIVRALLGQKLPDLLILALLFIPLPAVATSGGGCDTILRPDRFHFHFHQVSCDALCPVSGGPLSFLPVALHSLFPSAGG